MKVALADKPAVPFRVPPGIKLIRVDPKTGMRLAAGSGGGLLEAFKPGTAPPDSYAIIGYEDPNNPNPQPNRRSSRCRRTRTARSSAATGCTDRPHDALAVPRPGHRPGPWCVWASRKAPHVTVNHLLFLLMSLIWGVTWAATKAGIAVVPPLFFGAVRYMLVSAVLADRRCATCARTFGHGRALRLIVTGALVVVG